MDKVSRENLSEHRERCLAELTGRDRIRVGTSTCGVAAGAESVLLRLEDEIQNRLLQLELQRTGCNGMCHAEPLVEVLKGGRSVVYGNVGVQDVNRILEEHVQGDRIVRELDVLTEGDEPALDDIPTPGGQMRIALRNCGIVDPASLEHYIARGGYEGLCNALFDLGGDGVIDEMRVSGLRGRGGAGYPVWRKWRACRDAVADEKYMICNGDEGDPGAYMDRGVLEGDPYSVVEGMTIAGFALGATMGIFYIRAEYPLAIDRIEKAIRQAKRAGLLGKNILGTDFCYDLEVRLGAGAFVCGEETALMASVEGRRGTPWPRPPFPAEKGLWGKPSNINNVETLANVPTIIRKGAGWYAGIGTESSKGTKVFAVTGKVRHPGLVEIAMGTTLREIVERVCGGALDGHRIKAVQTGGPSGGVIPEEALDTPVSYEDLQRLGSIMGSGGMIVMDERDSMVDIARFYLGFCVDESCGKCAPCRVGGRQMLVLLEKLLGGEGTHTDIELMRRLSLAMQRASLCGLGQTAPNPVLSTLRYFENEYEDLLCTNGGRT